MAFFDWFRRHPVDGAEKAATRSTSLSDYGRPGTFYGGKTRRSYSWTGEYGIDHDAVREKMRAAWIDSVQLRALVGRIVQNAINTGLYPEPKPIYDLVAPEFDLDDRAEWERTVYRRFDLWARSTDATVNRSRTLYGLQAWLMERKLIDGEVFAVVRYMNGADRMSPVSVQLIDPSQIQTPYDGPTVGEIESRGNRVVDGIEMNRFDEPVAYWIMDADTGYFTRVTKRGPKSGRLFMIHSAYHMTPGSVRGVSPFAAVVHELDKITDYSVAELQAAVVNASIAAWVKPSDTASSSRPLSGVVRNDQVSASVERRSDPPKYAELENAGIWVQNLDAGEEIQSYNTQRPNVNFGNFVDSVMKQVSAASGTPAEVVHMSFNQNYSASRAALLLFWTTVLMHRADVVDSFLNPLYEQWLAESVASGEIGAPGIATLAGRRAWARCNWIGISHPSIDPLKEANAASVRIAEGLTTRDREAAAYNGTDFDDNVAELAVENAQLADANEPLETIAAGMLFDDGTDEEDV